MMNFSRISFSVFIFIFLLCSCTKKEKISFPKKNSPKISQPLVKPFDPETPPVSASQNFPSTIEGLRDQKPGKLKIMEPIAPIRVEYPVISCFDPNLSLESAVELLNSDAVDTQWFIVKRKKVPNHADFLEDSDTIQLKNKLQNTGWVLIDSSQTKIGNQVKILVSLQKEERICNIEKILYLHPDKKNHEIQETFEIRRSKKKSDSTGNNLK